MDLQPGRIATSQIILQGRIKGILDPQADSRISIEIFVFDLLEILEHGFRVSLASRFHGHGRVGAFREMINGQDGQDGGEGDRDHFQACLPPAEILKQENECQHEQGDEEQGRPSDRIRIAQSSALQNGRDGGEDQDRDRGESRQHFGQGPLSIVPEEQAQKSDQGKTRNDKNRPFLPAKILLSEIQVV